MKKLLFSLFLFTIALINAQNNDCTGAIPLTVGTDFNSGAITSNNNGATADGPPPSCGPQATGNVWFTAVVPQSGNLEIQLKEVSGSAFYFPIFTIYKGSCSSLNEIACSGSFSSSLLTGLTPGETLYISVWRGAPYIPGGEFQISAYEVLPPSNDNCSQATSLAVGTDFNSGAIIANNTLATTDGSLPTCLPDAKENIWFTAVVPQSGNLIIKMKKISGSAFDTPVVTVYTGSCGTLNEITCNAYALVPTSLSGLTPGETIHISVWKSNANSPNGPFQISAYEPIPPTNDQCVDATPLTIGTDFNSGAIIANNETATTDGPTPSCNTEAVKNIWFTAVVPQSGNVKIETREVSGSLFYNPTMSIYNGACGNLNEISCSPSTFSSALLTGQVPGETIYISIGQYNQYVSSGEFQISAYEPIIPANDNCSQATPLVVGTDFASGAITANNVNASTDEIPPSCQPEALENVWYTVTVPQSGNLTIETQAVPGSAFNGSILTVYSGSCGNLFEMECGNNFFSTVSVTGQTPGNILYVSVWKYNDYAGNGDFRISAYDNTPTLSTQEVTGNKTEIRISPNPFSDVLTISDSSDVSSVSVADTSGRLIKTIEKPSSSLHLKDLKEGLYYISLKMKDGTVKTMKAIKK